MNAVQVAEKRINDGISKIFTVKDYPAFLSFASNFLSFSYKNIILIYLQDPKAKFVAGINAWKKITELGIKKLLFLFSFFIPIYQMEKLNILFKRYSIFVKLIMNIC